MLGSKEKTLMNSKKLSFFLYYPLFLGLLFSVISYRFLLPEDISQLSVWGLCYFFGYSFFYYFFLNLVLAAFRSACTLRKKNYGLADVLRSLGLFGVLCCGQLCLSAVPASFEYCHASNDTVRRRTSRQFFNRNAF